MSFRWKSMFNVLRSANAGLFVALRFFLVGFGSWEMSASSLMGFVSWLRLNIPLEERTLPRDLFGFHNPCSPTRNNRNRPHQLHIPAEPRLDDRIRHERVRSTNGPLLGGRGCLPSRFCRARRTTGRVRERKNLRVQRVTCPNG